MQFAYDPEMLIAEVEKRPGLWNSEHSDYRAKNIKAKLWHEIVKELVSMNEIDMTKSQMRELELQLQKKWKSLRDCFQKFISNPYKFKRPYLYSKQLQFLLKDKKLPPPSASSADKNAGRKRIVDSSDTEDDETKPKNVWVPKKKIKLQKKEESDDNDVYSSENYSFEVATTIESIENKPSVSEAPREFAFANVDTEDLDKMFLMSLLPHLRSIPEEFRLNVKMELLQVLRVANESTTNLKFSSID